MLQMPSQQFATVFIRDPKTFGVEQFCFKIFWKTQHFVFPKIQRFCRALRLPEIFWKMMERLSFCLGNNKRLKLRRLFKISSDYDKTYIWIENSNNQHLFWHICHKNNNSSTFGKWLAHLFWKKKHRVKTWRNSLEVSDILEGKDQP